MNSSQNADLDNLSSEHWFSRLVKRRYGISMLATLMAWTILGFVPALESILLNGMLIDAYRQLCFLTVINVIAMFFCVSINRLLNSRIPGGWLKSLLGDGSQPWNTTQFTLTLIASCVTPTMLAVGFASELTTNSGEHAVRSSLAILIGCVVGVGFLYMAGYLKAVLLGSDAETSNFIPFDLKERKGLAVFNKWQDVLIRPANFFGLDRVDLQFLSYLAILAVIHYVTTRWVHVSDTWLTSASSMVVLLIWIVGMTLAGVGNLLDRYRLPTIPCLLLVVSLLLTFSGSTRMLETAEDKSNNQFTKQLAAARKAETEFLQTPPANRTESRGEVIARETSEVADTAWRAVERRMDFLQAQDNQKGKTLVVVTCPGGGIHAAAWSGCVLGKLSQEYSDFADSVCVISGVSGGSVGTLCFVADQYQAQLAGTPVVATTGTPPISTEDVHELLKQECPALELAARSSLEEIAYGITNDDLYGMLLPILPRRDRGQRLEDGLANRIDGKIRDLTMGDWGDRAVEGTVPIVVFNSTDAVTGRRILFDSIPTPRRPSSVGLTSRPLNYRELMMVTSDGKAADVRPATAARTSATFPYVSPFTKPDDASPSGEAVALCDGGYVDNEGIVSAVNWIEFLLTRWTDMPKEGRPFDRILLLRIEPSSGVDMNETPNAGGLAGWFRWLAGPVETIAKVRATSQAERGNLETDLVSLLLEEQPSSSLPDSDSPDDTPIMMLGSKGASRPVDIQTQERVFRKLGKSKEENRAEWDAGLEEFKERLKNKASAPDSAIQGIYRPTPPEVDADEVGKLPVVVETIAFQNSDQVIPLNWKLSKDQKLWYLRSWELVASPDTRLRKTLNKYFSPTTTP